MENKEESKQEGTLYQTEGALKYKDANDESKPTSWEQMLYRTAKLLNKMDLAEIEVKSEGIYIKVIK